MKNKTGVEARNESIVSLYKDGQTMQDIADTYKISRQRVEQVLRANGVPRVGSGRRAVKAMGFICKECGAAFESTLQGRKYCSVECSQLGRRKYRTDEERAVRREELKEYYSRKSREYYQEVFKKKKNWREILRERNSRYAKKRHADKASH
jgi:hypothetical protein